MMDFTLNDEQQAIADLAGRILGDTCPPDRLRELERSGGPWFAADAWQELAKADLLGIGLPEAHGGGGYGFLEVGLLLEQQGRHVAPVPLLPTLVLGALPIARFGSDAQQARWLPAVVRGDAILTAAISEANTEQPDGVTATATDGGWQLDGTVSYVPAAGLAHALIVPAQVAGEGRRTFLVETATPGIAIEESTLPNDEPLGTITFTAATIASDAAFGAADQGDEIVRWIDQHATAGLCMTQVGVCDGALRLTADYVKQREQFGASIGTFQAVGQRIADAYVDTEAVRLTAVQAAWRLAEQLPADEALHIAKFWAADGGHRVVHACQHLHGGIGMDLDYPVHRYFRWSKVVEFTAGSAIDHLRSYGRLIASTPGR